VAEETDTVRPDLGIAEIPVAKIVGVAQYGEANTDNLGPDQAIPAKAELSVEDVPLVVEMGRCKIGAAEIVQVRADSDESDQPELKSVLLVHEPLKL
jgi:hypothetical protein